MKGLGTVLLIIFLLLGVYIVHEYFDTMTPAWQTEAAGKVVLNLKDYDDQVRNEAERRAWFTQFWPVAFTGLLCVLVAGAGIYYWKIIDERTESKARMVDGSFALQTFKNAQGQVYVTDPNKATFGVFGFDKFSGQLTTDASMVGPDRQLDYVQGIQRTRTAQAQPINEIRNAAQAKLASGYYDRPQRTDEYQVIEDAPAQLTAAPVAPFQPLSLTDAFKQSKPDCWLLGQNNTGLCKFNVQDTVHTGLVGATKTGKTSSTALLMALLARKDNMQVIALDGAGGVDWLPHKDLFEVHESDYQTIGDQLNEIAHIHDIRMGEIKRAGVHNIDELTTYTIPSLFVIMEEFGKTMQSFQSYNKKQHALTESTLSNLMRVSRKTGIYFLLIDQAVDNWGLIMNNVKGYVAYQSKGGLGSTIKAYHIDKLRPKGQFNHDGQDFDAWHTTKEVSTLARTLKTQRNNMLTVDSVAYPVGSGTVSGIVEQSKGEGRAAQTTPLSTMPATMPVTPYQSKTMPSTMPEGGTVEQAGEIVSRTYNPPLTGKPTGKKQIALVQNTYALEGSVRKTVELLYGKRNPARTAWVKEIVNGEAQRTAPEQSGDSSATHLDKLRSTYGHDIYINGEKLGIDITQRTDKLL